MLGIGIPAMNQKFDVPLVVECVVGAVRLLGSDLEWIINCADAEKCEAIKEKIINLKGSLFKMTFS